MRIIFKDLRGEEPYEKDYKFDGGIESYVSMLNESKVPLFEKPIYLKKVRENYEVEVALQYVTDKPVFDLGVNPETGGIAAVRVLNILKYSVPPVIKILSKSGQGAVIRPVFGEIPESVQGEVFTVIDCVGK